MDKKSRLLLGVLFAVTIISIAYAYKKYIVEKEFTIFQHESGLPEQLEE